MGVLPVLVLLFSLQLTIPGVRRVGHHAEDEAKKLRPVYLTVWVGEEANAPRKRVKKLSREPFLTL